MAKQTGPITRADYERIASVWLETRSINATATRTGFEPRIVRTAVEEGWPVLGLPPIREGARQLAAKPPPGAAVAYTLATAFDKSTAITRMAKELFGAVLVDLVRRFQQAQQSGDPSELRSVLSEARGVLKASDMVKIMDFEAGLFDRLLKHTGSNSGSTISEDELEEELDELVGELRRVGAVADDTERARHDRADDVDDELPLPTDDET